MIRKELLDFTAIDAECQKITEEMDVVSGLVRKCVDENTSQAMEQTEYISKYNSLAERYEKLQSRYDALQRKREEQTIVADELYVSTMQGNNANTHPPPCNLPFSVFWVV